MTNFYADLFLNNNRGARLVPRWKTALFIFCIVFLPLSAFSQQAGKHAAGDDDQGDEISVSLEVKGVGTTDVPAVYRDNDVYLSITHVFDFIKVRSQPSASFDTVKGFFLNEQDAYTIDKTHNEVFYKGKTFDVKDKGLIQTETDLYMNLKYFKEVFGLDGTFYFRRLAVVMNSDAELPAIREARQELLRRNLSRLTGDIKADTNYGKENKFFHFGMADWAVLASQQSPGTDETTLNLALGGVLAGGELNTSLNYYTHQAFSEKLQYYQWRYVDNDNSALRQVSAGKIFAQATSTLYAPLVGVQVTNTPTTYRHSYGTYTLTNTTEPGWLVELYVNDVLVDYKRADASGFYSFEVPLIYGFTIVKLRFYGPYGEERTSQQYINIPFNFVPAHQFEYNASMGIVEDASSSRFSRVSGSYGLSSYVTVGGGMEYLSSVTSGPTMPFLNTSIRLTQRLLLSGEYTYGVRSRGVASYRLPMGLQIDLDYTDYDKGQTAIYYNYLSERKAVISLPVFLNGISLFSRITIDQVVVPTTQYTNMEWAITGFIHRLGINVTTYSSVVQNSLPYLYSIASLTVPIPGKFIFTTQWQYDYLVNKPVFMKYTLERRIFEKGYMNLAAQDFFNEASYNFLVGFRYDFSFTRAAVSVLAGNNNTYSRVEAASGSLIVDTKSDYVNANNRTNVGKGAIVIQPFLDLNNNGKYDEGEPRVAGLKIKINGGRVIYSATDSNVRVLDLEPYYHYLVELDPNSLDNIAWQIKNKTLNVVANPNNFVKIDVPVVVVGEISGTVSVKKSSGVRPKGLGQIVVGVYDQGGELVSRFVTESDGFFNYLGLLPGVYAVRIDSAQLEKLHLKALPPSLPLHISASRDGDVADGLDFTLLPRGNDTAVTTPQTTGKDTASIPATKQTAPQLETMPDSVQVIGEKGTFAILVDIYENIKAAGIIKTRITRTLHQPVSIVQTGEDYKVEITGFAKRKDAEAYLPQVEKLGFKEALIIRLRDRVVK